MAELSVLFLFSRTLSALGYGSLFFGGVRVKLFGFV